MGSCSSPASRTSWKPSSSRAPTNATGSPSGSGPAARSDESSWFRDAEVAEAVDAILFVGLLPEWYPPNYDCGACGYATCAEFLHFTKPLRDDSAELEFAGTVCNLRDIDLGIAVGSAAKTAAIHSVDCRCQTRAAVAARKLGVIRADHDGARHRQAPRRPITPAPADPA